MYKGKSTKKTALTLANKVATIFSIATRNGYDKGLFDVAWNSKDAEQIQNLQQNVYQFSFAKCHEQLKATTAALYDSEGKIIPFNEFKSIASRINNEYATRYLPVEYNTAIASAQMASRWVQYQDEKDIFPNLTYRTVGDKNVRPSHQLLDGVTRPIDDVFWDTNYTPNGWACRCDVEQSTDDVITPSKNIVTPTDTPKIFQTNLAKTGLIFPKDHPYYNHLPDAVIKAADNNNPFLYEKLAEGKKGGYVYKSVLHGKNEFDANFEIAKFLSNLGHEIILLPEIKSDTAYQNALRDLCLPKGVIGDKNADALLNGKTFEFKTNFTNTKKAVKQAFATACKQAENVLINIKSEITPKDIITGIWGEYKGASNKPKELWIIRKGKLQIIKMEDLEGMAKAYKKQKPKK